MTTSAELTEHVVALAHQVRRASQRALAPLGLTPAQGRALRVVAADSDGIRMGELACRMNIVPRSATGLIAALEDAGLVVRAIDPDNRRSILVTMTDRGHEVMRKVSKARTAAGAEMFAGLTDDERGQLANLLARARGE